MKLTLADTASGYDLTPLNNNFSLIEAEFQDKVLYRDNPTGEPNQMEQELDMNSYHIYNLPLATESTQAINYSQLLSTIAENSDIVVRLREARKIATDGQKVFNLSDIQYVPNTNSLQVYVNGVAQVSGIDFAETDTTTISFYTGLVAGDAVDAYVNEAQSNNIIAETVALSNEYNSVADMVADTSLVQGAFATTKGYYSPGDGGGNEYQIVSGSTGTADGGSFIDLDNGLQARGLFPRGIVYANQFGAAPSQTASVNTAAIQAAIDYRFNNGGGYVDCAKGDYSISETSSSETWENESGDPLSGVCLILRNRVYLRGAGINNTVFSMPANTSLDGIFVTDCPDGYGMMGFTLDGGWDLSTEVNSHGIFWVTETIAEESSTVFQDGDINNVKVQNVGSYGFGTQYGRHINTVFRNIRTKNTGSDGIDVKGRVDNQSNKIVNAVINEFGLRGSLLDQAGIDVRGTGWVIENPKVATEKRSDTALHGIRLNGISPTRPTGSGSVASYVNNFNVKFTGTGEGRGITSYGQYCGIGPGDVLDAEIGVFLRETSEASASDNTITGVTVRGGGTGTAFLTEQSGISRTKWIGCTAINMGKGWAPSGTDEKIIGCQVSSVATPIDLSNNPVNLRITESPDLEQAMYAPGYLTAGPTTIADDTSVFIDTGSAGVYQNALISSASLSSTNPNGLFVFRSNSSPSSTKVSFVLGSNVDLRDGVYSGTTGTDGNFTISAVDGGLYLENRTGVSQTVVLTLFGTRTV